MPQPRRLSLDHLTAFTLTPPQLIQEAARVGCEAVSIRVQPMPSDDIPTLDMIGDTPMRRDTLRLARDLGIEIYLVEAFMVFGRTEVASFKPALESAAALGASVVNAASMDRNFDRFCDHFAAFAELAASFGLKASVEPLGPGPLHHVHEARTAVERSGRTDTGIMTDMLHLTRSGDRPSDLDVFEPSRVLYAQLCDGPAALPPEQVLDEAMHDRHVPGSGQFDLAGFLRHVPRHVPLGIEVPMRRLERAGVSASDRITQAVQAARDVLARLDT